MIVVLLAIPLLGAVLAYLAPGAAPRRLVLVLTGVAHAAVAATTWVAAPSPRLAGWLALDPLGRLFLSVASALFLASAVYGVAALRRELPGEREDFEEGLLFDNAPEATFAACLLLFLAAMTLVTVSQAFGLLWVGVEATTLASAPLIYFHRHHRSLEATWKYLLICSVGIALALLGNFFLAVAVGGRAPGAQQLGLPELLRDAKSLDPVWLKAAFLLFLVGYGTKMGLAPLHTWLPDAHSEAPSVVSALLSGALLNCALLGIIRAQQVCVAAGQGAFGQELLVGFGLLSMGVAAVFIPGQPDYKRMLAYSSVEHMGITSLGIGLGGVGTFGAMLHAVNHSLTKAALFFVAGNILAEYRSKSTAEVRGVLRILPASGVLWVAGLFAITGTPPFGSFLSELIVLDAALGQGGSRSRRRTSSSWPSSSSACRAPRSAWRRGRRPAQGGRGRSRCWESHLPRRSPRWPSCWASGSLPPSGPRSISPPARSDDAPPAQRAAGRAAGDSGARDRRLQSRRPRGSR